MVQNCSFLKISFPNIISEQKSYMPNSVCKNCIFSSWKSEKLLLKLLSRSVEHSPKQLTISLNKLPCFGVFVDFLMDQAAISEWMLYVT